MDIKNLKILQICISRFKDSIKKNRGTIVVITHQGINCALDTSNTNNQPDCVVCSYEKSNELICNNTDECMQKYNELKQNFTQDHNS